MADFPVVEITMSVATIFVLTIISLILMCLIVHLVRKTYQKWKKKTKNTNTFIMFLIITIIGISSFEISLILIIIVVVQILLLDDVIKTSMISSTFFFETYPVFEYLIGILDALGHLCMLTVFISRFQYAFKNEIFHQSKLLIWAMYSMLAALAVLAFVIIIFIIPSKTSKSQLLAWEITWELCVESMSIVILLLFMHNLYKLLSLSLFSHLSKDKTKEQLVHEITKLSLEHSKSASRSGSKKRSKKASKSGKFNNNLKLTMTIDGTNVAPIELPSTNKSITKSNNNKSMKSSTCTYKSEDENMTDVENNNKTPISVPKAILKSNGAHSHALEILTVMSKMTLLVIIAAVGSCITIIGNFIIESSGEFNEKDIATNKGLDHDAIWVFILPAIDMVITSFMLYLQFNFTHKMYRSMCHCLDIIFLKCMLSIIAYCWLRNNHQNSFVVKKHKHMEKHIDVQELQTKSTVTAEIESPKPIDYENIGLTEAEEHTDDEVP